MVSSAVRQNESQDQRLLNKYSRRARGLLLNLEIEHTHFKDRLCDLRVAVLTQDLWQGTVSVAIVRELRCNGICVFPEDLREGIA